MEERLAEIERELAEIKKRNKRVQLDKAWEVSMTRTVTILVLTYFLAAFALFFIGADNYSTAALIPALGYFLSRLSLRFLKRWWTQGDSNS